MTVLLLCLNTYENHRFWEVEEWKTMTVLLLCLKTYENHWFWEVEEWKTVTVLLFQLKTYENHWFWEVEEQHSQVLDTPGLATRFGASRAAAMPTNLCWYRCGGFMASKPVLAQARCLQGFKVSKIQSFRVVEPLTFLKL